MRRCLIACSLLAAGVAAPAAIGGTAPARWPAGRAVPFWVQKEGARERNRELVRLALVNWQEASGGLLRFEESEEFLAEGFRIFFAGHFPDFGTARAVVDPETGEIRRADVIVVADPMGDRIQRDLVVYLTALHELGHALGLRHSEQRGEIMYGFHGPSDAEWTFRAYRRKLRSLEDIGSAGASGITGADRQAIRALYAAKVTNRSRSARGSRRPSRSTSLRLSEATGFRAARAGLRGAEGRGRSAGGEPLAEAREPPPILVGCRDPDLAVGGFRLDP